MLKQFQPFIDYAKLIEMQANTVTFDKTKSKCMQKLKYSKAKVKSFRIRTTNK